AASHQNHIPVEVETRLGKIRGQESIFLHKRVRSFLSVPFAEPPIGEQRFRPPKPKKPWNQTITANTFVTGLLSGIDMFNFGCKRKNEKENCGPFCTLFYNDAVFTSFFFTLTVVPRT
ncbi:hypothetical protein OSTOST_18939, partial [Ostertagia ostertagi]